MSLAMEKKEQKDKVTGAIEALKGVGLSETDIVERTIDTFGVTKEYVLALLSPKRCSEEDLMYKDK